MDASQFSNLSAGMVKTKRVAHREGMKQPADGVIPTEVIAPMPAALCSNDLTAFDDANDRINETAANHRDDQQELSPLSPEQFIAFEAATKARGKIDKAANVAGFNAWSSAVMAALSLPFALFDPMTLVISVGLAIIAANEFKGRAQLKALEPNSLTRLMWNQILFAAMLIGYSIFQIVTATTGPSKYAEYLDDPQLARMLGPIDSLHTNITLGVYGSMIAISLVIQGSTALYYHRRRAVLDNFVRSTPEWVLALQRSR